VFTMRCPVIIDQQASDNVHPLHGTNHIVRIGNESAALTYSWRTSTMVARGPPPASLTAAWRLALRTATAARTQV